MAGIGGKPGWAWIFILEGLATVVAGFLSFWIIQDFPDSAKFLTDVERTAVIRRLQSDGQHSAGGEKLKMKYIKQSLSDRKTYLTSKQDLSLFDLFNKISLLVLIYPGCSCPLYAFALFLPTIINQVSAGITNPAPGSMLTPNYS
jgi:hypothetical protein